MENNNIDLRPEFNQDGTLNHEYVEEQERVAEQEVTSQPEEQVVEQINPEELNGYIQSEFDNPFRDTEEDSPFSDREERRMSRVPVTDYKTLLKYINQFDKDDQKIIKAFESSSPENLERFLDNLFTLSNIHSGSFGERIAKENITNSNKVGNTEMGIRKVEFQSDPRNLSTKASIARFQSLLGVSNTITVSLYHSGFTIGLSAPTQAELNNLQLEVYSETLDIGRNTSAFIASHKRGGAVRILRDYIKTKIVSCSLNIDLDDVFKHISILDFDSILLGLLAATYVDSIVVSRTCKNSQVIDETGSIKCMKTIRSDLNPKKMLFVNKDLLTNDLALTVSKRTTGSVELEEKEAYVSKLKNILLKKRDVKDEIFIGEFNNVKLFVKFNIPSVDEFVEESDAWVEETKLQLDDLIDKSADVKRATALETIMTNKILTNISAVIVNFRTIEPNGQEIIYTDKEFIKQNLMSLSGDMAIAEKVLIELKKYLNDSTISIVAINKFTCPSCQAENQEEDVPTGFEDFIPINMLDFLFTLVGDRIIQLNLSKEIKSSTL